MSRPKNAVRKVQKTFHLEPDVFEGLSKVVAAMDLTFSDVANLYLRRAVVTYDLEAASEAALKRIENTVKRSVAQMADGLTYLCAVGAIEASTTRQVLFQHLRAAHGDERAKDWNVEGRKAAVRRLKETPDELLGLILAEHQLAKPSGPSGQAQAVQE